MGGGGFFQRPSPKGHIVQSIHLGAVHLRSLSGLTFVLACFGKLGLAWKAFQVKLTLQDTLGWSYWQDLSFERLIPGVLE